MRLSPYNKITMKKRKRKEKKEKEKEEEEVWEMSESIAMNVSLKALRYFLRLHQTCSSLFTLIK